MKFFKKIQKAFETFIHPADISIEVRSDVIMVKIGLGGIMANDDADTVMKLAQKLTDIAYENGYEPSDTPFHFSIENEIVYKLEFFLNAKFRDE